MTLFPRTHHYKSRSCSYVGGIVQHTEADATFVGSIQPITGKDTEFLAVGRMDVGSVKIYSNTPLHVSEQGTATPGDLVSWQGRTYEVVASLPFQNGVVSHYKYLAQDVGENNGQGPESAPEV